MITPERYTNKEVSAATGLSKGAITAYASRTQRSTRDGWPIPEIVELLNSPRRERDIPEVDPARVRKLRAGLIAYGWEPECDELAGQIMMDGV